MYDSWELWPGLGSLKCLNLLFQRKDKFVIFISSIVQVMRLKWRRGLLTTPLVRPLFRYHTYTIHSVSECVFQVPKWHQAAAHIWGLLRWWKLLLLMYKIFDMRTFGLSHQIKGPTTVKLAIFGYFTIGASFSHFYSCRSFNLMW